MQKEIGETKNLETVIKDIKTEILKSRYVAARLANKELLKLYLTVGQYVSQNSRIGFWGTGAIAEISKQLSNELPGSRGFSEGNIKKMRLFYEAWEGYLANRSLSMNEINDLDISDEMFFSVGFTNHVQIIMSVKSIEERLFYISKCATEFWSKGEFKPEYVGKLNFYLSALDEYVKLPNENPSIGIILCKSKDKKTVEFSFRDTTKPMGVASFKTSSELPSEYKGIIPSAEDLTTQM